jgi:hypothetical protein
MLRFDHAVSFRAILSHVCVAQIVAEPGRERHAKGMRIERSCEDLTLMTIGALLGVKIFRQNAEHIVTLDANTVEHWLSRRRSFLLRGMNLCLVWLGSHEQILA